MLLLMQQGFFTPEQQVRLAEAIIAIFVAGGACVVALDVLENCVNGIICLRWG